MAECHHTPELASAKVKYPIYRQLTVLETSCESPAKSRGIGINYVPVNLEPCIVLRGKWLRQAGFAIGQKITVAVNQGDINLTPKEFCLIPATKD
ncbi:SymE family type I addiction module toxin [Thalassomonas actiniarum]|uniref:Type I addiction module toxin, SymE family n=1 Tax=Thalassomonas actiniarum TaxID=485447 RepID=A0AAE9YV28_9GAMM|nr:SymE family type I addiction module toxin [Thalassomonas actiniarum]WDE01117.1 type I addiction module toxin, SymE family [Thalassomonas actiniarum]